MRRPISPDAYAVLGVTPRDDFATIKQAWRKLVRENHPDVAKGDPEELTRRLSAINEAYDAMVWHRGPKAAEASPRATVVPQADPKAASQARVATAAKRQAEQQKKARKTKPAAQTATAKPAAPSPRAVQRTTAQPAAQAPACAGIDDSYVARMFRDNRRILNAAPETNGIRLARSV